MVEVQSHLQNTMNSPQRKYFKDKHEPYAPNLSSTIPHIKHSHTPKLGFNGMQLKNGQGGMLSPQNGPNGSCRKTAMSTTVQGQSGFHTTKNSFFSPNKNHMKDTFFQLPHMNP